MTVCVMLSNVKLQYLTRPVRGANVRASDVRGTAVAAAAAAACRGILRRPRGTFRTEMRPPRPAGRARKQRDTAT